TRIPGIGPRFDHYLKQLGLEPVVSTIATPGVVPASPDVAEALGVPENTLVVHRIQRQGTTTAHYRLVESLYPGQLAGGSILERLQQDERFNVLLAIKEAHGKAVKRVHEDVIGRLPLQREQDLLKIVRSTPILEVHRIYYAEDDKTVIMYSRVIFVASYFVL